MIAEWFARPIVKYGLVALAALAIAVGTLIVVNRIYSSGKAAGVGAVTSAVEKKTIEQTEKARIEKEKIDGQISKTPFSDRVDQLK